MAQTRPSLTVDVNVGGQGGRNVNGKVAAQSRASAQGPQSLVSSGGMTAVPGEIVSEADLLEQGGFSSDEEGEDAYAAEPRRMNAKSARPGNGQEYENGEYLGDSDSSDGDEYGRQEEDVDMGSEDEDGMYDDDDEGEMSSSPSIPDENIDFDLVYALHNFIATVEGQATVNKGNSLTLLDDSNSYWWLVRVLRTQEVGYIPAENIETPFERLARLNKHRNVDLTSATDDDHIQVPEKIYTSHLIKQRSVGAKGLSSHSGKLSALSLRNDGPLPTTLSKQSMRGVQFGPPTYLEHSGNEASDDEEYDDDDDEEYDEDEDDEGDEGGDEEGEEDKGLRDDGDVQSRGGLVGDAVAGIGAVAAGVAAAAGIQGHGQQRARTTDQEKYLSQMEPDDGMDWDAHEAERVQRAHEERNAAKHAAEQRRVSEEAEQRQQEQERLHLQQQQQQQQGRTSSVQRSDQAQGDASSGRNRAEMQRRPSNERSPATVAMQAGHDRPLNAGFLPSQVQTNRDRAGSDASSQQGQAAMLGRASPTTQSPDSKRDKRLSQRKSKTEEDVVEEKQGRKRSGVFSGLFSRSKDKKERKSGNFGHQSVGSADGESVMTSRSSEESSSRRSLTSYTPGQSMGMGRTVQERDRAQQEAYQRQFLQDPRREQEGGRAARPGSLIGTPATVPMLNVIRVFAGNDIDTDATFKTVLLNDSTTSYDLVRQAMQRFRLGGGHSLADYVLTVKLVEGDERVLDLSERPLQVFDQLTETLAASNRDTPTIPSVKRSSVGSISSVSSNLSLNPAIARLGNDFSDDHEVKFYLHRKATIANDASMDASLGSGMSNSFGGDASFFDQSSSHLSASQDSNEQRQNRLSTTSTDTQETIQASALARFALRLLIFPSDLPEGIVFDPQTNALIPQRTLTERGPTGAVPGEGVEQQYREKVLALPKNTTVAEVIEQGLDRFGIVDGVVEGGDDVEERSSRRRSKGRVRYGLCIDINNSERSLLPTSKILEAYPTPPIFRVGPNNRRGTETKRRSADSAMLLTMTEEIRPSDPVFILRQVHTHKSRSARALSPTEDVLLHKQDQRRQAELDTVAPTPSAKAIEEARVAAAAAAAAHSIPKPVSSAPAAVGQGMTRQEIIAAQRAAARERRAAVLGAQRNEEQGVDVVLDDQSRIRSSKAGENGRVRYSFIPVVGQEQDISSIVEDVLKDQRQESSNSLVPPRLTNRSASGVTLDDYESAPTSPIGEATSPLSLAEVHFDTRANTTAPLHLGTKSSTVPKAASGASEGEDVLARFVRNPNTAESTIEDRIDQVLSRVGVAGSSNGDTAQTQQRSAHLSSSSRETTASPISGSGLTHQSSTTMTTPLSMLAAGAAGAAGLASVAASAIASTVTGTRAESERMPSREATPGAPSSDSRVSNRSLGLLANSDFGLDHLYTVVDAASRKRPAGRRATRHAHEGSNADDSLLESKPTVAGLFPPPAPAISDRRVKDIYAPIGKHLNNLEESLDQLLSDVLRTF